VIGAKKVTAPDGTVWQGARRWVPAKPTRWRPKKREKQPSDRRGTALALSQTEVRPSPAA
jgi:hypothetical protein